jgi:hypothetical protein
VVAGDAGAAVSVGDLQHHPLPYIVSLKETSDDDQPAQRWEKRVVAYSIVEAVAQAMVEVGGMMPHDEMSKAKFQVENVQPDVAEYWRLLTIQQIEARKALGL